MAERGSKISQDRAISSSKDEILQTLGVSRKKGLSADQVGSRRREYGPNRLREAEKISIWKVLANQFKSLIVLLLVLAAGVSFIFGEWVEGIAIAVVIAINTCIGFFTEIRAVRSMEALRKMGRVSAKVRRDGKVKEVPAEELVPGDIVILESGDIITADLRLLQASKLQCDESALTGESVPVSKGTDPLEEETPLAERTNMAFKGTAVTRGSGEGVVIATGMDTELGEISALVEEAEEEITPLEERLAQLGHRLIYVTLTITAILAAVGISVGKELLLMIETAIALAVAAIPEGLPIVATIALARGMWRMAKRHALVRQLAAVETLGGTNVIFTDKTGTLTENQMTVTSYVFETGKIEVTGEGLNTKGEFRENDTPMDPADHSTLKEALQVGILCNNASLHEDEKGKTHAVGDPVEIGLLVAGAKGGFHRPKLAENMPEEREEAFDPQIKMMATYNRVNSNYKVAVKGAPEPVLKNSSHILTEDGQKELSDREVKEWLAKNNQMAEEGLRILALASKTANSTDERPYQDLTFLGLVGMLDPPRKDVRASIDRCQDAGIRVVMITGDQPVTAKNIGLAVGLTDEEEVEVIHTQELKDIEKLSQEEGERFLKAPIFARVNPKQKLDLIELHQRAGSIVAMTGDGVNDAPALKKADIGIAMGMRGTQVAREAADMVLTDDAFSTIVAAIEGGRVIFNNIRKFVLYLLSCNISEIMAVAIATLANAPLPILPLQILFLNLVTDVFPALALGLGEGDPEVMNHPPRDPKEPILTKEHWLKISGYGSVITAAVLGALWLALEWLQMETPQAVSVSFLTLAFSQLWHVFNIRDPGSRFLKNEITKNRYVWGALGLCSGLLLAATYIPGIASVLKIVSPGPRGWILVIVMSLAPWVVGQIYKTFRKPE